MPRGQTDAIAASVGVFPLPSGSDDQITLCHFDPGPYAAVVQSGDNVGGDALVEAYLIPLATGP